ncbi:uncharacterized protein LOC143694357 isoform X3 [Agelaius phoeniceus]|uniref:uncharacterized protein LOC143694357 isoform X3 n=1 Tax=Agelaius phoeniceus TaxID=39638 RepID=UPI004055161E
MKQEAGVHMKVVRCTKLEINITTCLEGRGGDATAEDRYPFQRFLSACKQAGILSAVPSTPLKDSLSAELLGVCQAGGDRGCVFTQQPSWLSSETCSGECRLPPRRTKSGVQQILQCIHL